MNVLRRSNREQRFLKTLDVTNPSRRTPIPIDQHYFVSLGIVDNLSGVSCEYYLFSLCSQQSKQTMLKVWMEVDFGFINNESGRALRND